MIALVLVLRHSFEDRFMNKSYTHIIADRLAWPTKIKLQALQLAVFLKIILSSRTRLGLLILYLAFVDLDSPTRFHVILRRASI